MSDIAQANPATIESQTVRFSGSSRNLVPGLALLVVGAISPMMGLTHVFFAEALAWVFAIWGALFVYLSLIDIYETYEVTDEALIIKDYFRIWEPTKTWEWDNIVRADVVVKRVDGDYDDAQMRVFYDLPGEGNIQREDRDYNPELMALVLAKAGLSADGHDFEDLSRLPEVKGVYSWN